MRIGPEGQESSRQDGQAQEWNGTVRQDGIGKVSSSLESCGRERQDRIGRAGLESEVRSGMGGHGRKWHGIVR